MSSDFVCEHRAALLFALVACVVFWFGDAWLDTRFFVEMSFMETAVTDIEAYELFIRFLAMGAIFFSSMGVSLMKAGRRERREADNAVRQSEERFRNLFGSDLIGMAIADGDARLVEANGTLHSMLGYDEGQLVGVAIRDISYADEFGANMNHFAEMREGRRRAYRMRKRYVRRDGSTFWADLEVHGFYGPGGQFRNCFAMVRDITPRMEAEEGMRQALATKDMLMRELNHRVKNNLVVIQSLLNLQARDLDDSRARAYFGETENRVRAISLIHDMLTSTQGMRSINAAYYLNSLVNQLFNTYAVAHDVEATVQAPEAEVDIDLMIPLGLIINELVSNAFKHAFVGRDRGVLRVLLQIEGQGEYDEYTLNVKDDGIGLPEGFDVHQTQSLGCSIVLSLVKQLGGRLRVIRSGGGGGTEFSLAFSAKPFSTARG